MTGPQSLQQRARVEADVARSFDRWHVEYGARSSDWSIVDDEPAAPQIAPAEDLQADPDIEPGLTPRYGVTLAAVVAVLITVHLVWEHMGRPTLAEILSAIMETLNV